MYKQITAPKKYIHNKSKQPIGHDCFMKNNNHYDQLLLEINCLEKATSQMQKTIASKKISSLFSNASMKLAASIKVINILANLKHKISTAQYKLINFRGNSLVKKAS